MQTCTDGSAVMKDLPSRLRSLLRRQTTLVLSSVDEGGTPHSTPLFFIADEDMRLYWFSSRTSRHSRNCARSPRASVAVFRPTRRWKQIEGLQMEGMVSAVAGRAKRRAITRDYCARFVLDESFAGVIQRSTLYCFTPELMRYLNNQQKLGDRFELRLTTGQS